MKNQFLALLALVVALGSVGLHFWERPQKIAYAETSILLSEFNEAVVARKKFEAIQHDWDKNLNLLNDSLTASMNHMKQSYDQASKSSKDSMRISLQKRNEDLQRYTSAIKKMSQDKEKELMEPVIKKMNSFLSVWGREHNYDLVLGTLAGGNILQANEKLNLTSQILKDLNEHYKDFPLNTESSTKPNSPEKSELKSDSSQSKSKVESLNK